MGQSIAQGSPCRPACMGRSGWGSGDVLSGSGRTKVPRILALQAELMAGLPPSDSLRLIFPTQQQPQSQRPAYLFREIRNFRSIHTAIAIISEKQKQPIPACFFLAGFWNCEMDGALNSTPSPGPGGAPEAPAGPRLVHQTGDIGLLVRRQRKSQGLRIDDAAAFTHVSVDLLSRLENGQGSVGLEKVLSVLDGLGLCLVVSSRNHPLVRALVRADPPGSEPQQP